MYKDLRTYIDRLQEAGELHRVSVEVNTKLEIAEIADREAKKEGGGKALLFEQTGTQFPVLINMMGSDRRMAWALGVENLDALTQRIEGLFAELTAPKPNFMDKLRMLPLLEQMSRWLPRNRSGRGACQQVVWQAEEANLDRLPILQCWPHDAGRFITLPMVNTLDPDTGARNVGMYRMQQLSPHTTGMHWHLHKTGERHYRAYKQRGERMPVAVCLGGDPAYTYAATAPMPDNLDEYLLAGFLRQRPVELVRCLTSEIRVPADCDFVIEGYVDPKEEKVVEGPFGDHTGFYSLEDHYPVFHVTTITHRSGAVYPATIVGIPPQEDAYIAKATEKIFLAPIRAAMLPEVEELYMPQAGVAHNLAVINIRTAYQGQGLKVASSMWGAGQMMFNKYMIITATQESVRNPETLRKLLQGMRIPQDLLFSRGPLDVLDHAASQMGLGGKLALDLTGVEREREAAEPEVTAAELEVAAQLASQLASRALPAGITRLDLDLKAWGVAVLLVQEQASVSDALRAWITQAPPCAIRCYILLDDRITGYTPEELLWLVTSNCDPVRDITLLEGEHLGANTHPRGLMLCDARTKTAALHGFTRPWPNVVASTPQTIALVDSRWPSYNLGPFTPSPSLKYLSWQRNEAAAIK